MRRLFATWALAAFVFFYGTSSPALAADAAPAASDESRLIRLETKVDAINDRLAGIEKHMDQRMDGIEKRMDRLEQRMDRFEQSFRADIARLEGSFRADIARLEGSFRADIVGLEGSLRTDMNSQFERLNALLIGLCSIFGLLVVALFGFVFWDRRSMLRPLESNMRRLEGDLATKGSKSVLDATVSALRTWAQENQQLAAVLKRLNLM